MKRSLFIYAVTGIIVWLTCVACSAIEEDFGAYSVRSASQTEIHFFYLTTCPYSKSAGIYISENYPDLKVKYIDLNDRRGEDLFKIALKEYKLGNYTNTPLICCGNHYIQGWDYDKRQMFDIYAQRYQQAKPDTIN
ncbi:MAG: hypothetical protein VZR95_06005 [Alphaproteobacteria bacterium]